MYGFSRRGSQPRAFMKSRSFDRFLPRSARSSSCLLVVAFIAVFILGPYHSLPDVVPDSAGNGTAIFQPKSYDLDGLTSGTKQESDIEKPVRSENDSGLSTVVSVEELAKGIGGIARSEDNEADSATEKNIAADDEDGDGKNVREDVPSTGSSTQKDASMPDEEHEARQALPDGSMNSSHAETKDVLTENVHTPSNNASARAQCLKHIMYDKPIKTGSTAVTKALKKYLKERGDGYLDCIWEPCTEAAVNICEEEGEKVNLVDHIRGREGMLECLGRKGYYRVTSVRHPYDRWESSYLFNQKKNASHYGIRHTESYAYFMNHYPTCALHHYYDNLGKHCDESSVSADERTRRIVEQYDEVIDLYNEGLMGQVHRRIEHLLKEENKSPRPNTDFREPFNESRMADEMKLYNALKKKQREVLSKQPLLC